MKASLNLQNKKDTQIFHRVPKAFFVLVTTWICSTSSAILFEGGVSGGGGNMISPKPPLSANNPEIVEEIVGRSQNTVLNYLWQKRTDFEANRLSASHREAFAPVFENPLRIEDAVRGTRLHIAEERSCWDSQHKPVDGSTFSKEANSICISAYNIAKKADLSDIHPQSVALMIHEYSELIGLSEEQAVKAQAKALEELRALNLLEQK